MRQIGDRIDELEKRFDDLENGFSARVRAGIDAFIAEEKAKHELPGEPALCKCEDPLDEGMTHCQDKPCFTTPAPEPAAEVSAAPAEPTPAVTEKENAE